MAGLDAVFVAVLIAAFAAIGVYDMKRRRIPNFSLLMICTIKLVWCFFNANPSWILLKSALTLLMVGTVVLAIWWLTPRRYAMGAGDYKYIMALAFCIGVDGLALALAVALAAVLVWLAIVKLRKRKLRSIPAAPTLSLGATVGLLVTVIC